MPEIEHRIFHKNSIPAISFVIVCVLFAAYLQFFNLGNLHIVQWDESRLAVNAAEMSQNNQYWITSFENRPDLYNTKPPLMIWLQTLSIKIFGLNEFAIRFPSALSGILCLLLVGRIIYKKTKNYYLAGIGLSILAYSGGFIQLHGSMTGDFDSLLTLFILLSFDAFETYLDSNKKQNLYLFICWQALAIMTKSAAAFIPLPIWFILILYKRKWKALPKLSLAILLSLVPFIAYIFIRELLSAGYLEAIWANDFHGRFSKALEGHHSQWYYYFVNLFDFRYHYWIWILPLAMASSLYFKQKNLSFYALGFLAYISLLSIAKTRIHWYDMPLLPLLTIVIGLFLNEVDKKIKTHRIRQLYFALIILALIPIAHSKFKFITYGENLKLDLGHYELSQMIKDQKGEAKYIANWYDAEFYFYTKVKPNVQRGQFERLKVKDTVLLGNLYRDSLTKYYEYKLIKETNNARTVVIMSDKREKVN
ncbi:MAG: glycosyltransferase family 39 protein [Bacteroidia bacterium]|nr:glycosyltransferase family 39 protein [Bacteroidia bacterium]